MRIDLNVDLAEGFGFDADLMAVATSVNLCCGAHAGSEELARATQEQASARGLAVGLHPGYPDRPGMGRRTLALSGLSPTIAKASLIRQCRVLAPADYLKPHGAFYNEAANPGWAADTLRELLARTRLPLLGRPGTEHERVADAAGVPIVREAFADRGYLPDGRLVPRGTSGALLDADTAARQAVRLAPGVDSLCVHGDRAEALEVARAVRAALEAEGWLVTRWA